MAKTQKTKKKGLIGRTNDALRKDPLMAIIVSASLTIMIHTAFTEILHRVRREP